MNGRVEVAGALRRVGEELAVALRLWREELEEGEVRNIETLRMALELIAERVEAGDHDS